jgi:hypothetical protein
LSIFSGNALADTHRSVLYYLPGQLSIQSSWQSRLIGTSAFLVNLTHKHISWYHT